MLTPQRHMHACCPFSRPEKDLRSTERTTSSQACEGRCRCRPTLQQLQHKRSLVHVTNSAHRMREPVTRSSSDCHTFRKDASVGPVAACTAWLRRPQMMSASSAALAASCCRRARFCAGRLVMMSDASTRSVFFACLRHCQLNKAPARKVRGGEERRVRTCEERGQPAPRHEQQCRVQRRNAELRKKEHVEPATVVRRRRTQTCARTAQPRRAGSTCPTQGQPAASSARGS